MKMPAVVWYILTALVLLGLGTCAIKKVQHDAVAKAKAEETVQVVLAENKRVNAVVDLLRKSAAKDSTRADSAEKLVAQYEAESNAADTGIAEADSASAALDQDDPENQDWHALYLAQLPRIEARDTKITAQANTIGAQAKEIVSLKAWGAKGWAAADSLKANNVRLVNDGIKAALALNQCKIGPFNCPPRWAVALVTAAGTLYASKK